MTWSESETSARDGRRRQRWASGTLQALRLRQGPLRLRGLRAAQAEGAAPKADLKEARA